MSRNDGSNAEEWRSVSGYEGAYEVSSMGRVRSFSSWKRGELLRPRLAQGYPAVGLWQGGKPKYFSVHRLMGIAFELIEPDDARDIDHVNGIRHDNRIENLRAATRSQNLANGKQRDGASTFRGVWWHRQVGKWAASCGSGPGSHLGLFASEVEAAIAYDDAARMQFGAFARLNFPEEEAAEC
jgi:hypothetical protein